MKTISAKDLMVPLSEYATVSQEGTLWDAVSALQKAQEELDTSRYKYLHRAVLVYDENKRIVGKIGQLDVLEALEPKYGKIGIPRSVSGTGFSTDFIRSMLDKYSLLKQPLRDICTKAAKLKVKTFMHIPTEGEYVEESSSLDEAIHLLVIGRHQSLLVTNKQEEIVGILRLTDVFRYIWEEMRQCEV